MTDCGRGTVRVPPYVEMSPIRSKKDAQMQGKKEWIEAMKCFILPKETGGRGIMRGNRQGSPSYKDVSHYPLQKKDAH